MDDSTERMSDDAETAAFLLYVALGTDEPLTERFARVLALPDAKEREAILWGATLSVDHPFLPAFLD